MNEPPTAVFIGLGLVILVIFMICFCIKASLSKEGFPDRRHRNSRGFVWAHTSHHHDTSTHHHHHDHGLHHDHHSSTHHHDSSNVGDSSYIWIRDSWNKAQMSYSRQSLLVIFQSLLCYENVAKKYPFWLEIYFSELSLINEAKSQLFQFELQLFEIIFAADWDGIIIFSCIFGFFLKTV